MVRHRRAGARPRRQPAAAAPNRGTGSRRPRGLRPLLLQARLRPAHRARAGHLPRPARARPVRLGRYRRVEPRYLRRRHPRLLRHGRHRQPDRVRALDGWTHRAAVRRPPPRARTRAHRPIGIRPLGPLPAARQLPPGGRRPGRQDRRPQLRRPGRARPGVGPRARRLRPAPSRPVPPRPHTQETSSSTRTAWI